jgi:hypothetical protein
MKTEEISKRFAGGKSADGVWQKIVNLCPPHGVLIEPFAGEGTLTRKIRPAPEAVLVDLVRQPGLVVPPHARFVLGDGIAFLKNYRWKGNELVYADPPYLLRSRGGREYYEHEMSEAQHERLLTVLNGINANVLLSGYRSPLYDRMLTNWHRREFQAMTRGGTAVTECLWFNYPPPAVLHDYSVVGDEFRARQRLRKKTRRAVADLASLPPLERGALFAALAGSMGRDEFAATAAHAGIDVGGHREGLPRRNGREMPESAIAETGATAADVFEGGQLLQAYRQALVRVESGHFEGSSILAGRVAKGGKSYVVRVELRRDDGEPAGE